MVRHSPGLSRFPLNANNLLPTSKLYYDPLYFGGGQLKGYQERRLQCRAAGGSGTGIVGSEGRRRRRENEEDKKGGGSGKKALSDRTEPPSA
jgi:hypothetical protein